MAISLKHNFTSAVADEGDTSLVRPSNWNAEHDLTLATSRLVGRTTAGTGSAEEISVGTGLNLSSGTLAVGSTTPQVNAINTFTNEQIISVSSNTLPALRITQTGTADALRVEDETSPDSTPFVITAAGHAIAGYGQTLAVQTVEAQFQSHTNTFVEGGFGGVDWGNTATGQVNWFGKSRGGSYGTQAIVQSGDIVGDTRFYGSDGVGLIPTAKIEVAIDGTPGVNDMPGRISMYTTADGAASPTERLRIGNAGQLGIGGATYGTSGQVIISGGASSAPSWGTLGINGGGTGQTTASAAINALTGYLSIVSAGGTTTLTNASSQVIYVSGTSNQTIVLPDVTTLQLGWSFTVINGSTGTVSMQSSGLNAFATTITSLMTARLTCIAVTGTTVASWVLTFEGSTGRTGTGGIAFSTNPVLAGPTINNARYGLETITAGTNAQGQGAITASTEIAAVTTTANNPSGVTLNTAGAGKRTTVFNLGTNPIVIYPPTGGVINSLATNAGVTLPVGYSLLLEAQSATQWRTQDLGTAGRFLESNGASSAPTWASIANTDVSGLGTMSTQNANSVTITGGSITGITDLAIADGGTGQSTASAAANALDGYLNIVSSGGVTTLTNTSPRNVVVTGTLAHTIQLPDVTTLALGWSFIITNTSTGIVTVQSSGGNSFANTMTAGLSARIVCVAVTGTTTASWSFIFSGSASRSGTGSVVLANNPTLVTSLTVPLTSGGTAASSTLTLQSTTGVGTSDAIILRTGSQAERFRFDTSGALGIGGANYGTAGQVLTSGGSGAAPSWTTISAGEVTASDVVTLALILG